MYHHFLFLLQNPLFRLTQTSAVYYPLLPAETEDFRSPIPVYGKNSNPVRVYRSRNCSTSRSDRCCRYSYSVLPRKAWLHCHQRQNLYSGSVGNEDPTVWEQFPLPHCPASSVRRAFPVQQERHRTPKRNLRLAYLQLASGRAVFSNTGFGFFGTILFRFRNSFSLRYIFMNSLPVMVLFLSDIQQSCP